MFAHKVSFHLKSNVFSDHTRAFDKDILPLLRKQNGFRDDMFAVPGGSDVTAISLWNNQASAETYKHQFLPRGVEGDGKIRRGNAQGSGR